jgi:hypothetical protein
MCEGAGNGADGIPGTQYLIEIRNPEIPEIPEIPKSGDRIPIPDAHTGFPDAWLEKNVKTCPEGARTVKTS